MILGNLAEVYFKFLLQQTHILAVMIRKLPQSVINEIAAGEVIQRPFNVIKELVQNSIDAGATQININIQQGGLKLIKISDNGKGIMLEDFPLLCARFATSKIKDFADMRSLDSFGFRGEALASLSYVSNLVISSKWQQDKIGHSATFKNQQIVGKIVDIPMNVGTTITASDLFSNSESRKMSLNPVQQKKRIYKLLCHFCLHYPKIKFSFVSEKGDEGLPSSRISHNQNETKMQIFQQITKLSYDKFSYISPSKIGHGAQIQAIITKINCCKGKTLMLNVNNRIIENPDLFKAIQKAYSQCYQSIHEDIQSFWVYLSLKIDPKLIDCNLHPTKKAIGLFAGQQIYQTIKQLVLSQIKKDSAIKVLKPTVQSQKNSTIHEMLRQKMGLSIIREHNQKQPQNQAAKSKNVYAFEKNRTDAKQMPIQYYNQPQFKPLSTGMEESETYFEYQFECGQKNAELRKFFAQCSYVGCYGLNYVLIHYQNKLFVLNIVPLLPAFIRSFCQNNKLIIKQLKQQINVLNELQKFITKTKLLPNSSKVKEWLMDSQNAQLVYKIFRIDIKQGKARCYPCLGDIFVECIDQDYTIGAEIAYLICRVYNACTLNKLNKKLQDKFFVDFLSSQFLEQGETNLSPFNQKINNFFKNRVIPIFKTTPIKFQGEPNPKMYMKQMLDLKDVYKIFQRC